MRRLLWVLLAALTLVPLGLLLRHGEALLPALTRLGEAPLETKITALVLLAMAALILLRQRFPRALESVVVWALLVMLLALGYTYRFELREVGDRVLAEFVPGHAATRGRMVEVARGSGGSFGLVMQVNGARVPMVLDTGASAVVLTQEAARTAGLPLELLNYSVNVETANGRARAAPVTLDRIGIGGIAERSVAALIAQPGQLRTSLLGMSFLNRLERWEVRGDRLLMQAYP